MKKRLFVLVALLVLTAGFAVAQTTGTIILQGTVDPRVEILVTPFGTDWNDLDLESVQTDLQVATVTEFSNVPAGYTVSLGAANYGGSSQPLLVGSNGGSLEYTVKYGSADITFPGTPFQVTDASAPTAYTGVEKDLFISYDGTETDLPAGTYTDTLTFTITAK